MISLSEPLTLPCGQVLPNRIMKAALSEALGDRKNAPDGRLERLYSSWSEGGYGLVIMIAFIVLLLDGLLYAWKRGLLRWV